MGHRACQGLKSACFAVADPIINERVKITNLPWQLDVPSLSATLGVPQVRLINDFQAIAYGIQLLDSDDFVDLNIGNEEHGGTCVILGAGTGLGQSVLVRCRDGQDFAVASEGSHVDFAPTDTLQSELLEFLKPKLGRVTVEHLVSGPGLVRIYDFLLNKGYETAAPELLAAMKNGDPAEAIGISAMDRKDAIAVKALDLFIELYGAHAGDLALTCLAKGGVFVAGGIAPKIINCLTQGNFMKAFTNKAPVSGLLQTLPVTCGDERKSQSFGYTACRNR